MLTEEDAAIQQENDAVDEVLNHRPYEEVVGLANAAKALGGRFDDHTYSK